jgi:hypothetical protein
MAETLLEYPQSVQAPDGHLYRARACGSAMAGGAWQGWIEFVPLAGGDAVCTPRETTQPNRVDTAYWATGVSAVYLEGALRRALANQVRVSSVAAPPPAYPRPAPDTMAARAPGAMSVLDPFSAYEKGEPLLRKQLSALASWHLVNIILEYELSDRGVSALSGLSAAALVEMIVASVRQQRESTARRR